MKILVIRRPEDEAKISALTGSFMRLTRCAVISGSSVNRSDFAGSPFHKTLHGLPKSLLLKYASLSRGFNSREQRQSDIYSRRRTASGNRADRRKTLT
jgi:hypothetical protein